MHHPQLIAPANLAQGFLGAHLAGKDKVGGGDAPGACHQRGVEGHQAHPVLEAPWIKRTTQQPKRCRVDEGRKEALVHAPSLARLGLSQLGRRDAFVIDGRDGHRGETLVGALFVNLGDSASERSRRRAGRVSRIGIDREADGGAEDGHRGGLADAFDGDFRLTIVEAVGLGQARFVDHRGLGVERG